MLVETAYKIVFQKELLILMDVLKQIIVFIFS